jgi:hypothetical protein
MAAMNYLALMDWQQPLALLIVAATAGAFVWHKSRNKKFSFEQDTHCGCSTAPIGPQQRMTFRARKGERPQVIIKNQ